MVSYTYSSLNRLTGAAATGGQWGQAYTFDGFGNLTAKTVTQGSESNWTQAADPATNRLAGEAYDANGNWLPANSYAQYDVENRMASRSFPLESASEQYYYDPFGKRVAKVRTEGTNAPVAYLSLYDQAGGRTTKQYFYPWNYNRATDDVYFAGKLVITQQGKAVVTDRLGTVRADGSDSPETPLSYLPYGEGQNPPTGAGSQVRFATYTRDSILENQDYADQRYYSPWLGRFNSADPSMGSTAADPGSWNKYAYAGGDPVNRVDPSGLVSFSVTVWDYPDPTISDYCWGMQQYGWMNGPGYALYCGFGTLQFQPGARGGGGGARPFDPSSLFPSIRSGAINDAMSQLDPGNRKDVDCIGLFSGFTGGMDPSALLAKLDAGDTPYGEIVFGRLDNLNLAATESAFLNLPDDNPQVGSLITLNNSWSGAFLADTGAHAYGITILHELVHAFERIFGGNSPFLKEGEPGISDAERTSRSLHNTQVIKDNCFK